nr:hypothetical protein [Tanacetum cinerariifolium]
MDKLQEKFKAALAKAPQKTSVFRGFFEKQKLTGPNFIDWYRQLRIVLSFEDNLNYLEYHIPAASVPAHAGRQVAPEALAAHAAWVKGSKEIELKTMFAQQAQHELLQTMREFHSWKQEEGQSVSSYVLNIKSYIDNLERLGHPVTLGLGRAAVEAIGSYHLSLPSGLVIVLNNCHYAPSITRGIISVSSLYDHGYVNRFMDISIQVFRNNMVYFSNVPRDVIFEIDLFDSYTNVSSMHAVSNKRDKSNLDSALLWHCRLVHISRICIKKSQHDGLLNSTDLRAFKKCVLCMSENSLTTQEASESLKDLKIIQEEDTHPSIETSLNHEEDDLEIDEPQSDIIPIRRSTRTRHAPDRMCLYIDAEEPELGDLDNKVWDLVDLPPNYKIVGSKWLFKKKTDMDEVVHTYKACLVAKGYTQTSWIHYEETFSLVADILGFL